MIVAVGGGVMLIFDVDASDYWGRDLIGVAGRVASQLQLGGDAAAAACGHLWDAST